MKYIVKNNNEYHLIQAEGFVPEYEEVYECPEEAESVQDVDIVDGVVVLNSEKQSSRISSEAIAEGWLLLRTRRDRLLSDCDFTQLADSPFTSEQKAAWANYRQELRDLPADTQDPANPIWPSKPE